MLWRGPSLLMVMVLRAGGVILRCVWMRQSTSNDCLADINYKIWGGTTNGWKQCWSSCTRRKLESSWGIGNNLNPKPNKCCHAAYEPNSGGSSVSFPRVWKDSQSKQTFIIPSAQHHLQSEQAFSSPLPSFFSFPLFALISPTSSFSSFHLWFCCQPASLRRTRVSLSFGSEGWRERQGRASGGMSGRM